MADREGGSSLLAFLAGAVCGTVAGLLLAPAPGEETRRRLRYMAEEISERAGQGGARLRTLADEYAPTFREAFEGQRERISAALEAGRRAFLDDAGEVDTPEN